MQGAIGASGAFMARFSSLLYMRYLERTSSGGDFDKPIARQACKTGWTEVVHGMFEIHTWSLDMNRVLSLIIIIIIIIMFMINNIIIIITTTNNNSTTPTSAIIMIIVVIIIGRLLPAQCQLAIARLQGQVSTCWQASAFISIRFHGGCSLCLCLVNRVEYCLLFRVPRGKGNIA